MPQVVRLGLSDSTATEVITGLKAGDKVIIRARTESPLLFARERPPDLDARARACLELVGLGERLHNLPSQLSGGQQRRVAIARPLVNEPSVVLADEPTDALDTETSGEIMELLGELNEQGTTIIVVTHEPEFGVHARGVIRLRDGLIEEDVVRGAGP